jgi:hypothetical protein
MPLGRRLLLSTQNKDSIIQTPSLMRSKNPQDPKDIQNVSASLVYYKKMDIVLTHAASKTRLKLLASNRNALEAVGTGGIEDSPALFSTALATAPLVGVAAATVMTVRKPWSL